MAVQKNRSRKYKVVLHVISGDLWAGAEVQVYQTLAAMEDYPLIKPVCILFNDGMLAQKLRERNIRIQILDETKYSGFSMIIRFMNLCREIDPDIIHVHKIKEHLLGLFGAFSKKQKIPLVRTIHGVTKNQGIGVKKLIGCIFVNTGHLLNRFFSDRIIAVSKDIKNMFHPKDTKRKVVHIYNAINIEPRQLNANKGEITRETFNINQEFWIGTAARLVGVKNIELLIDAGKVLKEKGVVFKISIFGEGALYNRLMARIRAHRLEDMVIMHGFNSNMPSILGLFDVFILSSRHEGLPMALLESMSLGTPVICTAVGGMREVIKDGVNGLLVNPDDPEELAGAIIRVKEDARLSEKLAQNARKTIENDFSITENINKLILLYNQLAS